MRSFFLFIIRHYVIFLFVFLELIAFYLLFSFNAYHNTYFINSANDLTGNVLNTYGNFQTYFSLREVNDSLRQENSRLRGMLYNWDDGDSMPGLVRDTLGNPLYSYVPAEVIGNTFTEANNYITLNKGSKHGIRENMGVIASTGMVGRVVKVSENFSVVMSMLHSQFLSRVAVSRTNAQGRLRWDGKSPAHIDIIQVSEPGKLAKGDTIITTPISRVFPPGILVGTLESYGKEQGSNYYTLHVKLSTKFSALKYVYVVNDLMSAERETLENQIEDADN